MRRRSDGRLDGLDRRLVYQIAGEAGCHPHSVAVTIRALRGECDPLAVVAVRERIVAALARRADEQEAQSGQ